MNTVQIVFKTFACSAILFDIVECYIHLDRHRYVSRRDMTVTILLGLTIIIGTILL